MKREKTRRIFAAVGGYAVIILGAALLAAATYTFTVPAKLIPGGVTGIASIIEVVTGFSAGYTIFILNVPIIIAAVFILDKKFTFRTLVGIALFSGFIKLFEAVGFYRFSDPGQPVIAALLSGVLSGVGTGMLLNCDSSPGGTEVLSMLIQKKGGRLKISYILLALNTFTIVLGASLYLIEKTVTPDNLVVILAASVLEVFFNSKGIDVMVNGMRASVKFEIITDNGDEMADALIREMKYGITMLNCKGAYTDDLKDYLVCVVPKNKIPKLKKVIRARDKNAFVCITNTREIMGRSFRELL